jgi:hypothetical protein
MSEVNSKIEKPEDLELGMSLLRVGVQIEEVYGPDGITSVIVIII